MPACIYISQLSKHFQELSTLKFWQLHCYFNMEIFASEATEKLPGLLLVEGWVAGTHAQLLDACLK